MKSKYLHRHLSSKEASLGHVLEKNEKIKKTLKKAVSDLTSVNQVLEQAKVSVPIMEQTLLQNKDVEQKVSQAVDDLKVVNVKLVNEMAERRGLESELADTKADLADVRDDLSKAQETIEIAQQIALQDALTGLPNRVSFEQGLVRGLMQAKRHGWGLAVMFIDIDKFKIINDAHGHGMGDQVLLTVANRLKLFFRGEDMVSRWGGNEFVCLLLEVKQEADVAHFAEELVARIAEKCEFDGIVFSITISIGIAIYPADGETAELLFENADAAMYEAKGTENRVVLFRALE